MLRSKRAAATLLIVLPFVGASVLGPAALASAATPQDVPTCVPQARGDNAHISTTSSTRAVQVHGWWLEGTCSEPEAFVSVQLQEELNGKYGNVGELSYNESLYPGGGSGKNKRVTGHVDCKYAITTNWRAVVTVSVGGENQGSAVTTTEGMPVPDCEA